MSGTLRLLGAIAVFGAAFSAGRAFSAYQRRRLAQCRGFLKLFRYAKRELSCYSRPIGAWIGEFRDTALDACGFTEAARQSEDMAAALAAAERDLCLSEPAAELLASFAASFGKGYREEEIDRLSFYEEEMERITASEERAMPRLLRLTRVLLSAGAAATVILLL